jgi:hypothetical protein
MGSHLHTWHSLGDRNYAVTYSTLLKVPPTDDSGRWLDSPWVGWDYPIMKLVADRNGRLACKELFTPGKPFSAERMTDGSIRLVELVEKEVPTVQPIRTKEGFLLLPVKLNRKAVAAAIRADRDSR